MTAKSKSAIVLLSGGLDSMVVAGLAREAGYDLIALTIDYNQRHRIELDSAATIAAHLGAIEHIVLPLDLTRFGGSALTADIAVPKEGVEENAIPIAARNLSAPLKAWPIWPPRRVLRVIISASTRRCCT